MESKKIDFGVMEGVRVKSVASRHGRALRPGLRPCGTFQFLGRFFIFGAFIYFWDVYIFLGHLIFFFNFTYDSPN